MYAAACAAWWRVCVSAGCDDLLAFGEHNTFRVTPSCGVTRTGNDNSAALPHARFGFWSGSAYLPPPPHLSTPSTNCSVFIPARPPRRHHTCAGRATVNTRITLPFPYPELQHGTHPACVLHFQLTFDCCSYTAPHTAAAQRHGAGRRHPHRHTHRTFPPRWTATCDRCPACLV